MCNRNKDGGEVYGKYDQWQAQSFKFLDNKTKADCVSATSAWPKAILILPCFYL